jgi:hypothetical protein
LRYLSDKAGTLPERSDLDDDMLHEEFNWLRPLYVRPYWYRVWIVQELVLAKVVIVCYGNKSIDFDDIYGLSLDWGSFEQGFDTGTYQRLKPHTRGCVRLWCGQLLELRAMKDTSIYIHDKTDSKRFQLILYDSSRFQYRVVIGGGGKY